MSGQRNIYKIAAKIRRNGSPSGMMAIKVAPFYRGMRYNRKIPSNISADGLDEGGI